MSLRSSLLPLGTLSAAAFSSCAHPPEPPDPLRTAVATLRERAGLVLADDPYGDGASKLVYLDQGWTVPETLWYYHADQGSVLLPYQVLIHLEQPDSDKRILDPANLVRYRLLPQRATPDNPDALPVGLTRHGDSAGLTCAACHTGQLIWQGTAIRVDGAPALADITGFLSAIRDAEAATLADTTKLARFAANADVAGKDPASRLASARTMLTDSHAWFESYTTANHSTTTEGYGRLDAVGRIINQVIRFTSDPRNSLEPNAPNSFPLLWDAPRLDYVQWTGFSPNAGAGSIGRNAGEVVGVFAQLDVKHYETKAAARKGYASTVQGDALVSMEESLRGLRSPVWPEDVLPPIDRALAGRGAVLYQADCVSCHALLDRADPGRKVTAMVTGIDTVGTDPQSADNLIHARAPSGVLEGAVTASGGHYGATASGLELLVDLVSGVLSTQPTAVVRTLANAKRFGLEEAEKQGDHAVKTDADPTADLRAYKARPLNGIWAAAPYLHNGSVPTLYDLLQPVAARPTRFVVGRWTYDPKKVGYVTDGEAPWVLDTSVTGNHNVGHVFGTTLSEEERWALVEYLKTL